MHEFAKRKKANLAKLIPKEFIFLVDIPDCVGHDIK